MDIRKEASTIETGSSATKRKGLVKRERAIEALCSCPPESSPGYFPAISERERPTCWSFSSIKTDAFLLSLSN